ncbi:FecR family protein [Paenibacillus sp. y28]|uniref:FecR family protein n=1 Tax=Paenibacillus sp. y28 TaxID=3129110 RepID=UPI003016B29B
MTDVGGTVLVTKSGGSKSYDAFVDMYLNEGDHLSTGSDSYVVLKVVDKGDEVTIGADTELYISSLTEDGGTKSKFSLWAGSVWSKVKKAVSDDDEYEVDTPTAVMGVKGTHLLTVMDPRTGRMITTVFSGVVETTPPGSSTGQEGNEAQVYPAQQIAVDPRVGGPDYPSDVSVIDPDTLLRDVSPEVLKAIFKNAADINSENDRLMELKRKELEEQQPGAGLKTFQIGTAEDLNRVQQNLNRFISDIAKRAQEQRIVDESTLQKMIDDANASITEANKKIDLDAVTTLDKSAGFDPEYYSRLQQKKSEEEARARQLDEQQKAEEDRLKQTYAGLLGRLADQQKRLADLNRQAEQKLQQEAEQAYTEQLTSEEKERFRKDVDKAESSKTQTSGSGTAASGSKGNNGSKKPAEPVVVSPTGAVVTTAAAYTLQLTAPLNSQIIIYKGGTAVSTTAVTTASTVDVTVDLQDGENLFSARTLLRGVLSDAVTIPLITKNQVGTPVFTETSVSSSHKQVTITYPEGAIVKQYKLDQEAYREYTGPISLYGDTTVYARSQDAAGMWTAEASLHVTFDDTSKASVEAPETVTIGQPFQLQVNLKDISLYAAEVHVLYNDADFTLDKTGISSAVFNAVPHVATVRQDTSAGASGVQREVTYVIMKDDISNPASLPANITVNGTEQLVTFPLTAVTPGTHQVKVYVLPLDMNSNAGLAEAERQKSVTIEALPSS